MDVGRGSAVSRRALLLAAVAACAAIAPLAPRPVVVPVIEPPIGTPTLLTSGHWRRRSWLAGRLDLLADQSWLDEGVVPGTSTRWVRMVRFALVDLHLLIDPREGSTAAGAAAHWAYTWPRDSAFYAVAMAMTGHTELAITILEHLQDLQARDGSFEARYLRTSEGVPDNRAPQPDGPALVLWALRAVIHHVPLDDRRAVLRRLRRLHERSVTFVLAATGDGTRLPSAAPDYWEVAEKEVTLGTAAPMAAALDAAAELYGARGLPGRAATLRRAAVSFTAVVHDAFGPGGYQRYVDHGGQDAATCYLMPPFVQQTRRGVREAWLGYQAGAARPGGGLAPGMSWHDDGVSWTPEVAMVAMTAAASGETAIAEAWLDWLDATRTSWESLPEKVLADGSPAGPAPLGWTAACVCIAVAILDGTAGSDLAGVSPARRRD